jgi:hypothetical protein
MIRTIIREIVYAGTTIAISLFNALVETYVAIRSIMTCIWWMMNFCTVEYTVEDDDGTIIHRFPQLNNGDNDGF